MLAMVNYFCPMLVSAWGYIVIDWLRRGQAEYINGSGSVDHDVDFLINFCQRFSKDFHAFAKTQDKALQKSASWIDKLK